MAEIYLGTQHGAAGFARPVVIKAITSEHSADPHFRNMLIDEAHIAMSLNHSNIVQVLDLGTTGKRYFLILEVVDGWDLDQIFKRAEAAKWPMPPEVALHITAEVCRALAYAHNKRKDGKALGIVHRDVSPHNILISEHGEVKLTDFGIAIARDKKEKTDIGLVKGKVGFMSPEQADGEAIDLRSDLFSLGTVLYLFVTGRKPFASPTDLETLLRTKEARYTPPAEINPRLPKPLCELIAKAMARAPKDRFESAEAMLSGVEKVLRSSFEPVSQTELKVWLAELGRRDKEIPASRLSMPPLEVSDDAIVSISSQEIEQFRRQHLSRIRPLSRRRPLLRDVRHCRLRLHLRRVSSLGSRPNPRSRTSRPRCLRTSHRRSRSSSRRSRVGACESAWSASAWRAWRSWPGC